MPIRKKTNSGSSTFAAAAGSAASGSAASGATGSRVHPNNIILPNGWKVGKQLSQGAQGTVYEVVVSSSSSVSASKRQQTITTPWVVKVTVKPTNLKSKTQMEARLNATSLMNEGQLYKAHLMPLRGIIVPNTPDEAQGVLESAGYLCLLMERMESDLLPQVEETVTHCDRDLIHVGPLATRMVELIEAIHKTRQLVIDIKPEKFMYASNPDKNNQTNNEGTIPSQQLRLVDFGLMRPFRRLERVGELQGAALYASLHMHTLHNSSRRDDLEMVLYVIGEIVIRVKALAEGAKDAYEKTDIPSYLPWSQAKSDEELYQLKVAQVQNQNSDFYKRMPLPCASILYQCLKLVWSLDFNTEPDYDLLKRYVTYLSVEKDQPLDNHPRKRPRAMAQIKPKRASQKAEAEAAVPPALVPVTANLPPRPPKLGMVSRPLSPVEGRTLRSGRKISSSSTIAATEIKQAAATVPRRTVGTQTHRVEVENATTTDDHCSTSHHKRRRDACHPSAVATTTRTKRDNQNRENRMKDELVDRMDIDEVFDDGSSLAAFPTQDVVDLFDSDDDDDVENKMANISGTNSSQLGVKLIVQTPGKIDVEYQIMANEMACIGSNKPPSGKMTATKTYWIEVPGQASCRLTPKIQRQRVIHVVVKPNASPPIPPHSRGGGGGGEDNKVFVGREGVMRQKEVPKGGVANCLIPGQVYVGSSVIQLLRP